MIILHKLALHPAPFRQINDEFVQPQRAFFESLRGKAAVLLEIVGRFAVKATSTFSNKGSDVFFRV